MSFIRFRRKSSVNAHQAPPPSTLGEMAMSSDLQENEKRLRQIFEKCSDIVFRQLHFPNQSGRAVLIYLDGLADTLEIEKLIIKPYLDSSHHAMGIHSDELKNQLFAVAPQKLVTNMDSIVQSILYGDSALLFENEPSAMLINLVDFQHRSVDEPVIEASIRGPREGFTEVLRINTSMIRRKINSPKLKMEPIELGETTRTRVVITYMEDEVDPDLLTEIKARLSRIKSKAILDSNYIEEQIEGTPYSLFPQIQNTERPDTVAASLMEGKVGILVDGSPNALLAPMTFWSGFQAADDHYERFLYVSGVRIIRILLFIMSLLLPSFYVGLTTFHPQMIPANLLISIAAAREGIPFPTVIETFIMEIMFEGLREAGLRLPQAVGSTVSIVGALVIGEAAVQAGIISAPIVIIVASTGIASFAIPRYSLSLPFRLLRFPLLGLSGTLGFYGIATGTIAILIHLCKLESFGVPYLFPLAPFDKNKLGDTLYREPNGN
nr:spore germination protein [Paenibacillus silvestris]